SKIATDDDLFTLTTLGFRGEALPSIASVSRFHLATREKGRIEGTEIYAEGGTIRDVKACGMAEGTVMSVRNLFFNTPARLKFMKSNETETGHVGDLLTKLAISHPEVRFTFVNDGKTAFRALPGDLDSRVAGLLGSTLTADLVPVRADDGELVIRGLISRPECSRSAASHLYTYINGRFIRDKVVQHAILQAYRNVLERGRYPVVVLFIELPPGEVDVNVHPTKHEVRFRQQVRVHDAIHAAVAGQLAMASRIRPAGASVLFVPPQSPQPAAGVRVAEVREALAAYQPVPPRQHSLVLPPVLPVHIPVTEIVAVPEPTKEEAGKDEGAAGFFSRLTVIGQFNAAYILCQDRSELVVVDQHAAHERVAFERLKSQYEAGGVESQGLLFPETLELSFGDSAVLEEHLATIGRLGFSVEAFGGTTWLVNAVPGLLKKADHVRVLRDILEELRNLGKSRTLMDARDDILIRIACHSVVRGQHALTREEIGALFTQMDLTNFAGNCPHGRPVYRTIPLRDIERMFKRI
ncbi:MAG TPA: DNA mismatch repair endonuclease MutL, partial [Geobacteraceae bacterium]